MKYENPEKFVLQADAEQISLFFNIIFKKCQSEGWFVLRGFEHEREGRPPVINEWIPFNREIVKRTTALATYVANLTGAERAVFSPPVAIFGDLMNKRGTNRSGGEDNVICAPAIAVELDSNPQAALDTLTNILGEPTLIVASGGTWEGKPKLHAYWRLGEPARTAEERALLRQARYAAARIAGGDRTGVALSHPMRMPGSWHTKGAPALCKIIGGDHAREIKLSWAVAELEKAAEAAGIDLDRRYSADRAASEGFKTETAWSPEDLMAAAELIPNDETVEWDAWSNTLMAFYDASHGSADGLEAAIHWSEKNPKGDAEATTYKWDHIHRYPPKDISAGTLVKLARAVDPDFLPGKVKPEDWFEDESAPLFPDVELNSFQENSTKRFQLTPFAEAASTALDTAAQPLIKGVLDQGAMTILYGESNAGKTFVAMDMAYHIAAGIDWAGKRTAKLPVLYVAAEGGQGARKRAAALASKHGVCEDFYFLMHPVNLLRADADLKPLIDTARDAAAAIGRSFGLVVIDTLSRAMAGGDENSSTDMGAMVKHLDVLRKALEAHVMAVHHSGKDRARGARGHSLLRAATDTEIEVADRVISVTKQRDLDGSFASGFDLDVVTLGVDAEGDPVTSCTVKLISRHEAQAVSVGVLTPSEATVAAAVAELDAFNEGENEGVGASELIEFLAGKLDDLSPNSIRQHLKRGVQKGALTKCRRGRWKSANFQSGQASGQDVFS